MAQTCSAGRAELWFLNDESGSVNTTEWAQSKTFIRNVAAGFNFASNAFQGGLVAWESSASLVSGLTTNFPTVAANYTRAGSGGTDPEAALTFTKNLIVGGAGRSGVPSVVVMLTDASSNQLYTGSTSTDNAFKQAADDIRAIAGSEIVVMLIQEAATAYQTSANVKSIIDYVAGSSSNVLVGSTYADIASSATFTINGVTQSYANALVGLTCDVAAAAAQSLPGVTFPTAGQDLTASEDGDQATLPVLLNTAPTANVTFSSITDAAGQCTFSPSTLTFTNGNYNVAQTITASAVDDTALEGAHSCTPTITVTSGDGNYNGFDPIEPTVSIADNETFLLTTSTITANPTIIASNGISTSLVTVQLKDAAGTNNLTASRGTVVLATTSGTLGAVTDNNDGTYSATLTSGNSPGTATITGTLQGLAIVDQATVQFVADLTPPTIQGPSGNAGDAASAKSVPEGTTSVHTFTADEAVTWSLTGGADQADFAIDASTGALSFATAPDFEAPADADTNNAYVVVVTATDNALNTSTQTVTVTVTDLDEVPPAISGPSGNAGDAASAKSVPEGTTAVHTFTANESVTWSLTGGADQADFAIDASTGALSFATAPDFEAPADADANNVYQVIVTATDTASNSSTQTVTVTVTDLDEVPPTVTSLPEVANDTVRVTLTTSDTLVIARFEADEPVSWSVSSLPDATADLAKFRINGSSGALSFVEPPLEGNYKVKVLATDTASNVTETVVLVLVDLTPPTIVAPDTIRASGEWSTVTEQVGIVLTRFEADEPVTWSLFPSPETPLDVRRFTVSQTGDFAVRFGTSLGEYKMLLSGTDAAGLSIEITVTVRVIGELRAPQLSGEPGDGLASLTWTEPVAGLFPITGYVLEYRTGSGDWIRISDLSELAQIVSGLENGRPYDFRVAARDSDGRQSPWSNVVTLVPSAPVIDASGDPPAPEPGGGLERTDDGFVPVTIERTETDDVKARTEPIELTLTTLDSLGVILPVDPARPVLRLQREGSVETKGTGFEPGTYADVFIFTPEGPRRLGQLLVGEDGTFEGEFPLPDDLPNGFHVIQVNGIDEEGAQRSVSVTGVLGGEEDLTVDVISSNLKPAPGEAIELTVIVTNRGSETAYDVEFDEGYILTRVDVETRTPERGEVDVEAGIWRIGTLAPGESVRLTLQGTVIIPQASGSGEGR